MASDILHSEVMVGDPFELTAIQLDEEHNVIYALTMCHLIRIDLNKNNNNVQIVYQHNRKFQGIDTKDDEFSQGEFDDCCEISDSVEDIDDDGQTTTNRRNWQTHGWRPYPLYSPYSMQFVSNNNQLVVLNQGVFTFLTIELEDSRSFVQGPSKNIFCNDFNMFNIDGKPHGLQPWSLAPTSTVDFFIFSFIECPQLYSLDVRNENHAIQKFIMTTLDHCPCLLFHL
jgi:hypothetical protein